MSCGTRRADRALPYQPVVKAAPAKANGKAAAKVVVAEESSSDDSSEEEAVRPPPSLLLRLTLC